MTQWSSVRSGAFEIAHRLANEQGTPIRTLFDDTLHGDLARFRVLRALRRRFPNATPLLLDTVIDEALTP